MTVTILTANGPSVLLSDILTGCGFHDAASDKDISTVSVLVATNTSAPAVAEGMNFATSNGQRATVRRVESTLFAAADTQIVVVFWVVWLVVEEKVVTLRRKLDIEGCDSLALE